MKLHSLGRLLLGFGDRPSRSPRRITRLAPRGVELLEGRELLSTVTGAQHHFAERHGHHHAIVESHAQRHSLTSQTYYNAANTTDSAELPVSGWQGIRNGDTAGQYLITGTSGSNGILYIGSINGDGTSYAVNVPNSSSTSVYGPNTLSNGQIQLVGSYRPDNSSVVDGFFFQGTTTSDGTVTGTYSTLAYPGATYNYIHSTMGGLAVGNSDGPTANGQPLGLGHASIYNVATGELLANIKYPGSITDSAYGIWYNGGTSYTIVGGFSRRPVNNITDQNMPIGKAYMVDFDSVTGRFSHWKAFTYPNGNNVLTHFQGISSPAPGVYTLAADSIQVGKSHVTQGSLVTVTRNPNGSFGRSTWVNLQYTGLTGFTSADSVSGNAVVGFAIGNLNGQTAALSYQATVNVGAQ